MTNQVLYRTKTIVIQRHQIGDDSAIGYFDRSSELRTRRWYRASRKFKLLGHEAPRCMVEKLQMCERGRAVARR